MIRIGVRRVSASSAGILGVGVHSGQLLSSPSRYRLRSGRFRLMRVPKDGYATTFGVSRSGLGF